MDKYKAIIEELEAEFNTFAGQYDEFLKVFDEGEYDIAYAGKDFFSLQPFFSEEYNLDVEAFGFVHDPDELKSDIVFSCLLKGRKLQHSREWYGQDVYYDSFFRYTEHSAKRYKIYINPEQRNPIEIEYLRFNDRNEPELFIVVQDGHARVREYRSEDYGLSAECYYFDKYHQLQGAELLNYVFGDYGIEIIERVRSGDSNIIYNRLHADVTGDELQEAALRLLCDEIIKACKSSLLQDVEIGCLILEYSSQYPLPPTLAFVQPIEMLSDSKAHPLHWLNAPDIELFSENSSLDYELSDTSLLDQFNSRIETMQEEEFLDGDDGTEAQESDTLIESFYIKLSKMLRMRIMQIPGLKLADQFYVVPRDYEQCNEQEYLQKVLPQAQYQVIADSIDQYELDQQQAMEANPDYQEYHRVNTEAYERFFQEIETLDLQAFEQAFADEVYFGLTPYYCELKHGIASVDLSALPKQLSEGVAKNYVYYLENNKPKLIEKYSGDDLVWQMLYLYTDEQDMCIKMHVLGEKPSLEKVEIARKENGRVIGYSYYSLMLRRKRYEYDESGKIVTAHCTSCMPEHDMPERPSREIYRYENDELQCVKVLSDNRQFTQYSLNHDFIAEAFDALLNIYSEAVVEALADLHSLVRTKIRAIIIEQPFEVHNVSLSYKTPEHIESLSLGWKAYDSDASSDVIRASSSKGDRAEVYERELESFWNKLPKSIEGAIQKAFEQSVSVEKEL